MRKSAEIYINLCTLMDRLAKRNEGLAADHGRLSSSLMSLTDASHATYAIDTNDVPLLNEGLLATAKHVSNSQSLLVDEARAWDEGVLEDLKVQRDALVSMREMFDRRDHYHKDNIPYLEKRIRSNEDKLTSLRQKPEGLVKPGEMEKVADAIIKVGIIAHLVAIEANDRTGQGVDSRAACSRGICQGMHPRRADVFPKLAIPCEQMEPGLGARASEVF